MTPVLRRSVCTRAGTHGRLAPLRHPDLGIPLPILGGPSVSPTGSPALPPALGGHTLLVRLRTPRPASDSSSGFGLLVHFQGLCLPNGRCSALLRFNFNYGDFIRWLGGEYTGAHRDWDATFDIVDSVRLASIPPGYPDVDFDRAVRIATEGVPLAGRFECQFESVVCKREHHNNGSLASDVLFGRSLQKRKNSRTTSCSLAFCGQSFQVCSSR
jgi:hypothetical protein